MSTEYSFNDPSAFSSSILKGGEYALTTRSINVSVRPVYLDDQSSPADDHYVWAYHVTIENQGHERFQILARTWHIIDMKGVFQEVHGAGLVGQMPHLNSGDIFEYTSGASLRAPSGLMSGLYHAATHKGESFDIDIPAFSLDSPYQTIVMN